MKYELTYTTPLTTTTTTGILTFTTVTTIVEADEINIADSYIELKDSDFNTTTIVNWEHFISLIKKD